MFGLEGRLGGGWASVDGPLPQGRLVWGRGSHLPASLHSFLWGRARALGASPILLPTSLLCLAPPSVNRFFRKRGCMGAHTSPHHFPQDCPPHTHSFLLILTCQGGAQLSWGECKIAPRMLHGSWEPRGQFCTQLLGGSGEMGVHLFGGRAPLLVGGGDEQHCRTISLITICREPRSPTLVLFAESRTLAEGQPGCRPLGRPPPRLSSLPPPCPCCAW